MSTPRIALSLCATLTACLAAQEASVPPPPTLKIESPTLELVCGQAQVIPVKITGQVAGKLLWSASGDAAVDETGRFLAKEPGPYFVSVKSEAVPSLAAVARVNVGWKPSSGPVVALLPKRVELFQGQAFRFHLEAFGTGKQRGTWRATGGTVNAAGNFVAPTKPGTYTVSVSYPKGGLKAIAEVRVVQAPAKDAKKIIAYTLLERFPKNRAELLSFDASTITHMNIAFGVIQDGQVMPADPARDLGRAGAFAALREVRHRYPHMKLLLSLGGWGAPGFSAAAFSKESRARFVASALDLLQREDLDGLDLDWEYPCDAGTGGRPEDLANFTTLVTELRQAFDAAAPTLGKRLLLTAATPAGPNQFKGYEWAKLHPQMDFINLMTYDYHGAWDGFAGFNAPINAMREDAFGVGTFNLRHTVAMYLGAGVPKEKLNVGVPFYGRSYVLGQGAKPLPGETASASPLGEPLFRNLDKDFPAPLWERGWNPQALQPTLWNATTRTWINYDDEASIRLKAAFIVSQELGGAMFWELGQDDGRLTKVLAQGMGRK